METQYNQDTHIQTLEEAKAFMHHVVFHVRHLDFHPDDKFAPSGSMTVEEAANYDRLMRECFAVCEAAGQDIYQLGMEEIRKYMVKHK